MEPRDERPCFAPSPSIARRVIEYVVGRDLLLAQGEALDPLIAAHAEESRPGHRALAQFLRVHRRMPEPTASWLDALGAPWPEIAPREGPQRVAVVRFPRQGRRVAARVATVHPSSILRAPDDDARHAAMDAFVADLERVATLVRT